MSGGELTGYRHNLYDIVLWAGNVEEANPLLAAQLRDLYGLLGKYDLYLSADIGKDAVQEAWEAYREKWLGCDKDAVKEFLMKECEALVDSSIRGWR